jgi:short-subunit dehydrogenase
VSRGYEILRFAQNEKIGMLTVLLGVLTAGGLKMANDKVAVVAGVGPGIGARFVETFAHEGYRVVALARNATSLEQLRGGLGATAERCVFWPTDITDQEQVKQTFARVRNELGPVNLLICNAGGGVKRGSFLDQGWVQEPELSSITWKFTSLAHGSLLVWWYRAKASVIPPTSTIAIKINTRPCISSGRMN